MKHVGLLPFGSRRGREGVLAGFAALALSAGCLAQDLTRQVENIVSRAKLGSSSVGVCVIDLSSGKEIASYRKDERMIPASNMKLLTSGAALSVLGPDYEFRTQLERHGDRIVIRGAGDPAFADPALLGQMQISLDGFMSRLVESVTRAGMTRCAEIIVDDRYFDRDYIHPDWPRDQLDKGYCAEVSGLNFHANVLQVFAAPSSRESEMAIITTEPTGAGIEVRSRARTVKGPNSNTAVGALRQGLENSFTITGTVNSPLRDPAETTLHEPSLVFARLLSERLADAGVVVPATAGVAPGDPLTKRSGLSNAAPCRLVGADEAIGEPDLVLAVVRTPLSVVLDRCNQDSENLYAESLSKTIGRVSTGQPGTWSSGASVLRLQVRDRLGPDAAATLNAADGSGMSRGNKVTASLLARWLESIAGDQKVGPAFISSLPRARAEGTMRRRFNDKRLANEVRGKSGLLNGVRTLSGYITDPETGRMVSYSILVNDIPSDVPGTRVKEFHEEVVVAVDQWLASRTRGAVQEKLGGGESRNTGRR